MDIKNTNKKYKTNNSIVYSCQYHVIWTTKYKRSVLTDIIQNRLKELILEKQLDYNYEIIEMEIMSDHIHLLIDINPQIGINKTVGFIKRY